MRVRVRLFASLREAVGRPELTLDLPDGATADQAWQVLVTAHPPLAGRRASLMAAVNRRYAGFDTRLTDGDELSFIPPVSGG
ncbi:MAG TPA: molybdopterin converting factor subunit 1 [Vicinamibacteria bacterium]